MKLVQTLHNNYYNTPVWIAGSDPSLDTYPDTFFDDKISITLHLAFMKFPTTSFMYANEADRVIYLKKHYPSDIVKVKHIYGFPLYGLNKSQSKKLAEGIPEAFYFNRQSYPPNGVRGEVDWNFTCKKVKQVRAGDTHVWGGHGTCLHGAFYTAIMLGANPINIIGAGHGMYSNTKCFDAAMNIDKKMRPNAPSFSHPNKTVPIIDQTLALIEACRKEGITVNWIKEYNQEGEFSTYNVSLKELGDMKKSYTTNFGRWRRMKNALKRRYRPIINSR